MEKIISIIKNSKGSVTPQEIAGKLHLRKNEIAVIKKMLDEKGIEYECIEDEMEMMLNGYEAVPVLETDECVYTRPIEIKKWIMEQ